MLNVFQPALAQINSMTTENEEPLVKVAILPDTQFLTVKGWTVFYEQTQYAVDWGADYVVHLGDIVNQWNYSYQWDKADIAFKTLDRAGIPYGVLAGNHDMDDGNTSGMGPTYTDGYEDYFPISRVKNNGVFQENYGEPNENHYDIIEKNGLKLLFISASWNITPDELDWVEGIIKKHPDHYVIMVTHGNIDYKGHSIAPTFAGNKTIEEKQQFFDSLERWRSMGDYDNVILQLSGHYSGSNAVDTGEVMMAMSDYQAIGIGPPDYNTTKFDPYSTHYIGLLTFYKDHIKHITYNPTLDDYIWSDDYNHIYDYAGMDIRPFFAGEEWEKSIKIKTSTNQTIYGNTTTKTITNANLPADFNFAAVGDWGCNANTNNTVNNILDKNPELVLALGDYSYINTTSADCWLNITKPIGQKMKIAIGNHDDVTPLLLNQLMNHFDLRKQYYSFNYENVHFTVISTQLPSEMDPEQYKFVKNDLANASSDPNIDWIVAYYHKPAYISPNQHLSYPQNATVSHMPEDAFRDLYHPLFDEYDVDLVLQAHQHAYERTVPISYNYNKNSSEPIITDGSTTYYRTTVGEIFATVGTGGINVYHFVGKNKYVIAQYEGFGFLNVNIINNDNNNGTTLSAKYYANDGTIKDRFTITKGVSNLQKGSEITLHSNNIKYPLD